LSSRSGRAIATHIHTVVQQGFQEAAINIIFLISSADNDRYSSHEINENREDKIKLVTSTEQKEISEVLPEPLALISVPIALG